MTGWTVGALVLAGWASLATAQPAELTILTSSSRGTAHAMGRDLATLIAPRADVSLAVLPASATDNVKRLRRERGAHLAIVQADVMQAWLDQAASGDAEAIGIVEPLRVVMPLDREEIYFIVRADSPLATVTDIRGARINLGEREGAMAVTVGNLYRLMFGVELPAANATHLSPEDALVLLITERTVDVVPIVGAQPAPLLAEMKPEARKFIKLLRYDPAHPSADRVFGRYLPATVRAESYPNLLAHDLAAIAVRSVLIAHDRDNRPVADAIVRLARSLCRNLPLLKASGHANWQEVGAALPDLGSSWRYHAGTSKEINLCLAERIGGS